MARTMPVRRGWWMLGGLGLVAVTWWRLRGPAVRVDVGLADRGTVVMTVDEAGTTRVRAHADINAPSAGRWVPAPFDPGDTVRAGTRLGWLYPAPLDAAAQEQAEAHIGAADAARREANAQVAAVRSGLDEAQRTRRRAEALEAAGGLSTQDVERARTAEAAQRSALEAADQRVRSAEFALASARAMRAASRDGHAAVAVVAPIGGTILRVFEAHDRVVPAGTPLAEVGNLRDVELVIPLLTSDAARVARRAAVRIRFGTDESDAADTVRGEVSRIEPGAFTKVSALGVEEQRVNVIVTVPAPVAHLGDAYRVQARVTLSTTSPVVRVPTSALVREGSRWLAYVVTDGRARRRPVVIGARNASVAEVQRGLEPGDVVVLYPGDLVQEGSRVTVSPRNEPP